MPSAVEARLEQLEAEIDRLKGKVVTANIRQVSNATRLAGERHTHGYATIQSAKGTGDRTLATTFQSISGCQLILERMGDYEVKGVGYFVEGGTGDDDYRGRLTLDVDGTPQQQFEGTFVGENGYSFSVTGLWHIVTTQPNSVVTLHVKKSGGSGTSRCEADNSVIVALAKLGRGRSQGQLDDHQLDPSGGPHTGTLPWASVGKTGSSLADLQTRTHASLSDAPTDAHHAEYIYRIWIPFALDTIPGISFTP